MKPAIFIGKTEDVSGLSYGATGTAERIDTGDNRVYHYNFFADGGKTYRLNNHEIYFPE